MSVFTDQTVIENTPLPIDGGNPNALKVDGSAVTQPISGTVNVGNFPVTQPVSGTVTVQQPTGTNLHVTVDGNVATVAGGAATSTVAQTTSNGSSQQLLASNVNRKKAILFFSSGIWFIKLGVTASNVSFTYSVTSANTTIEITGWAGEIDAICTTSGKLVNVTELS